MINLIIDRINFKKIGIFSALYFITAGIIASVFFLQPSQRNDFPMFRLFIIFFATILLTKYFIYMTLSPWHDVVIKFNNFRKKKKKKILSYNPRVSVIVPAWNEEVGLLSTINTILNSTYRNVEIVVVNDGSTDESDAMMKKFLINYKKSKIPKNKRINIIYHYKENGGKGRALNKGIELSTGEIIMSIDADCIIAPDAIANFVKCFEDKKVMAAVGNVKIGNTKTILGMIQHLEFLFSFYFKKAESLVNTIYIIGGAAGAFRREVFKKIGMYNHKNITEDIELSVRIQKAGMKIVYAHDALVYTEGAVTLGGLMKQRLRWKRGRFQTFYDHKDLFLSARKCHNKLLTFVSLPLAILGDIQLFFEVIFLIFLYVYSILTHDFSSFISGIIVVSSMFFVQMFFNDSTTKKFSFFLLAPIGWLLFYLSTFVEYQALIKSIWGAFRKKEVVWQKWQRKGVLHS